MIDRFEEEYCWLSNFFTSPIVYEGKQYKSVEHAFQAAKMVSEEWKEKIFSWHVWADPSAVHVKSDEYVLHFFRENPNLRSAFREEIENENITSLKRSFSSLYPIIGLEDPFLSALFYKEVEDKKYRKIAEEFNERVSKAVQDIQALDERPKLLEGLESIAKELASLISDMITQKSVQNVLAEIIQQQMEKKGD